MFLLNMEYEKFNLLTFLMLPLDVWPTIAFLLREYSLRIEALHVHPHSSSR